MLKHMLNFLIFSFKSRPSLVLENLALRHQLDYLQRNAKRPRLKPNDRTLWALLSLTFCPIGDNTWRTFIRNHLPEMVAIAFFTVHTATFRAPYDIVILSLDRRKIIHFNVTTNPTSDWTSLKLNQAFPFDIEPWFLIRDRDGIYGQHVIETLEIPGTSQVITSHQPHWRNGYCERVIGSIRRECLDHNIVFNETHLRRILKEYFSYYHESRTHLGLEKDTPIYVQPRRSMPARSRVNLYSVV